MNESSNKHSSFAAGREGQKMHAQSSLARNEEVNKDNNKKLLVAASHNLKSSSRLRYLGIR